MKGNIYPYLIRVFYTNLKFEGNNLVSYVKGVDMKITHEVWAVVAGLKYSGIRINKGNLEVVEDFNKIQYYKSCLKNQHAQVRTCSVGGLKLDERLLALIVTWILTPSGSNHFVLTEEDLVYIFYIMKKIKINWIHIIKEHMQKEMRLSDYLMEIKLKRTWRPIIKLKKRWRHKWRTPMEIKVHLKGLQEACSKLYRPGGRV